MLISEKDWNFRDWF